jgi:RNA polymerase sigma-70 factor (ECF subfamily)
MGRMDRRSRLATGAFGEPVVDVPVTFEELFAEHHERLFRALYLIVGSSFEAEELMQDAFLRVFERWDRIDSPVGYLYRTALNATRSRFRRLGIAAKRTLSGAEPEDPFAAADLRDELVRALKGLPERQRAALVLVDLLDQTSEEAARSLGVTPATVRSLASHGRAALKVRMEPDDG